MTQLQNNLKRLRRVHGLSKRATANAIGISRRTLDRILGEDIDVRSGLSDYTPTLDTVDQIATFFNVGRREVTKRLPAFTIEVAL